MDVLGKSGCIPAKEVVIGHKWLYSGKVVVIGQSGCIRARVVVFGQEWLYSGKSGCIWAKWLYLGNSSAFG